MILIKCWFCGRHIYVSEYDFARFSKGECILCDSCDTDFKNDKNRTIRI